MAGMEWDRGCRLVLSCGDRTAGEWAELYSGDLGGAMKSDSKKMGPFLEGKGPADSKL